MYRVRSISETMILGALCAGVAALPLIACRGVGLIEFVPELIPGSLIGEWLNFRSAPFNEIVYLISGALLALPFRLIFKSLFRAGWQSGLITSIALWFVLGIGVALISDFLPDSPLLLPAESPVESVYGLLCFFMIFATFALYGVALGFTFEEEQEPGAAAEETQSHETPAAEKMEQRKAA